MVCLKTKTTPHGAFVKTAKLLTFWKKPDKVEGHCKARISKNYGAQCPSFFQTIVETDSPVGLFLFISPSDALNVLEKSSCPSQLFVY